LIPNFTIFMIFLEFLNWFPAIFLLFHPTCVLSRSSNSFSFFSFLFYFVSFLFFPNYFYYFLSFSYLLVFAISFVYFFTFSFCFLGFAFYIFFCLLIATPESCSKLRRQVIAALQTQLESLLKKNKGVCNFYILRTNL
jgi:hypothetical protein